MKCKKALLGISNYIKWSSNELFWYKSLSSRSVSNRQISQFRQGSKISSPQQQIFVTICHVYFNRYQKLSKTYSPLNIFLFWSYFIQYKKVSYLVFYRSVLCHFLWRNKFWKLQKTSCLDIYRCVKKHCCTAAVECPIPSNPTFGRVMFNSVTYNSMISYECNYGYMIVGKPSSFLKLLTHEIFGLVVWLAPSNRYSIDVRFNYFHFLRLAQVFGFPL